MTEQNVLKGDAGLLKKEKNITEELINKLYSTKNKILPVI